jgi:YtcA-like protein
MQGRRDMNRQRKAPGWLDVLRIIGALFVANLLNVGCSRAPSFNILGSFFPSWILCGVLGILLAVATRLLFARWKLEQHLSPLIVVYPCLAAFFTFTLWLLFFS